MNLNSFRSGWRVTNELPANRQNRRRSSSSKVEETISSKTGIVDTRPLKVEIRLHRQIHFGYIFLSKTS